jgi:hypothetical protein
MVLRHGHVVAQGSWAPHTPERIRPLYSLSKSFTSTAVMRCFTWKVLLAAPRPAHTAGGLAVHPRPPDRPARRAVAHEPPSYQPPGTPLPTSKSEDLDRSVVTTAETLRPDTPGGPFTGNRVVPCPWQKTLRAVPCSLQATHVAADTDAHLVSDRQAGRAPRPANRLDDLAVRLCGGGVVRVPGERSACQVDDLVPVVSDPRRDTDLARYLAVRGAFPRWVRHDQLCRPAQQG